MNRNSRDEYAITKRHFLRLAAAGSGLIVGWTGRRSLMAERSQPSAGGIPYRTLGSTGEKVSLLGIGGYHMGSPDEDTGVRIVRTALDQGVNFLDNCWDYHDGGSEERMGRALRDGYREKAFLMSKIDGRDRATCARQIDESLQRLQTDRIDLMQFHEIIRMNDASRIFEEGGAMEALTAAQMAGKVRYIGFTGHKSPEIHLRMLQAAKEYGVRFDAVQMPLNVMDAHFNSFEKQVLPVLVKENIGVLGMKSMGGGVLLRSHTVTPVECLHYAMNLPTSVVITGCDSMEILDQALGAVRDFRPMSDEQVAGLLAKAAEAAKNGEFELYKVSENFDGTTHHPEWLGAPGKS